MARVTLILDDGGQAYAAKGVSFFVLPTGVFVRIDRYLHLAGPVARAGSSRWS